jgi:hypothetical protein
MNPSPGARDWAYDRHTRPQAIPEPEARGMSYALLVFAAYLGALCLCDLIERLL